MSEATRKRSPISQTERRLIAVLHDRTGKLLAADDYAEAYMARLAVTHALRELHEWIEPYVRVAPLIPPTAPLDPEPQRP